MNAAKVTTSDRLRRVAAVLSDGKEHSTRDIIINADVCAVNSAVAELRQNGLQISCRRQEGNFYYRKLAS